MTDSNTALPRLLTAHEVAEQLGLALPRVYQLARDGDLPHVRLGRSVRFLPDQVLEFLASGGTRLEDEQGHHQGT